MYLPPKVEIPMSGTGHVVASDHVFASEKQGGGEKRLSQGHLWVGTLDMGSSGGIDSVCS